MDGLVALAQYGMFGYNCLCEVAPGCLPYLVEQIYKQRRNVMGDKGGKKDKNKADKQKQSQTEKKKEQQKTKLPIKKP
jgi:hypothetical protein